MRPRRWLKCGCGAKGDMKNPRSLFGWQVVPAVICADCIQMDLDRRAGLQKASVAVIERSSYFGKTIRTLNFVEA